jgi:hypothetical protein
MVGGSAGAGGGSIIPGGAAGTGGALVVGGSAGAAGATADYSSLPSCLQPPESGPCNAAFMRYAFDLGTLSCQPFLYGGCGGNENNFATLEACVSLCDEMYAACEPLARDEGCPCEDTRDCASGRCFNIFSEYRIPGLMSECPASVVGLCTDFGEGSCVCPLEGGERICGV